MKKLLKPACLLFNVLMFITFFFVGISYAGIIEAGKGQMLAGGAIVLGYGVIFAIVAFIASFFMTYRLRHQFIVMSNIVLTLVLLTFIVYFRYQYQERQELKKKENHALSTKTLPIWTCIV
ncbi:DUF6077 domain-containing protein [Croceitalea rosinachiae]|uniref:DUF6077 domain-containing protein n=1 Tax=Croceitalea rosinachiae TaxID=3075596 RepID=A0ABU3AEX1_9FLAO|nr:DUF6077 domain-containing protein [Croceitalea sp. F388]MDT0607426.1 DUF6077 domain-containing protein [Croceitalea sp. F388]